MGTWYEAARYPHRFEKNLSAVSAKYTLLGNQKVEVVNRGYKDRESKWTSITGSAKLKGEPDEGRLSVTFFRPFSAAYKIIYLNDDYSEAIVTSSSIKYLWILTRKPELPAEELEALIVRAEAFGFDRNNMQIVDQARNAEE